MRLLNMYLDLRHTAWLLVPLACVLNACDAGPGGPLGLGGKNSGIPIGGSGGGTGADALSFTVEPTNATDGNIITPPIQVVVRDSGGNLSGTTSVAPVNGVAQFGDLSIDKAGTGYVLGASASGATGASSNSFNILAP